MLGNIRLVGQLIRHGMPGPWLNSLELHVTATTTESAADPITLRLAPKIAIAVATELAGLDLTALTVISWAFVVIGKKIPFKST